MVEIAKLLAHGLMEEEDDDDEGSGINEAQPARSRRATLVALSLTGVALVAAPCAARASGLTRGTLRAALDLQVSEKAKHPPAGWVPPWLQPCGGPCRDHTYTCVVKADHSYSQCIDCSDEGNYKFDCASYDNELRMAAVRQCGATCDLAPPTPPCRLGQTMESDYSVGECREERDRSVRLRCQSPSADACGTRLSSHSHTGMGKYEVTMQGAYGEGVATNFYIDTYGRGMSELMPYNEVKFEIWGRECFDDGSRIYTSFRVAGSNDTNSKMVKVNFDACDDWHTYTIEVRHDILTWKIDGELVRREDMSDSEPFLRDVANKGFETHFALWGQDARHISQPHVGFLERSDEEFPLYAWFANIHTPVADGAAKAPYQWIFDPNAHVR